MTLYADTSGLVKLILNEPGSEEMRSASHEDVLVSVELAYVELRAAIAAAHRLRRIEVTEEESGAAVEYLWRQLTSIEIDVNLLRAAGDLAQKYHLRAYDAVHLAGLSASGNINDVRFACWDQQLRRAAQSLGYRTLPA